MRLVTGGDGKIGYISHARARSGDHLFWRHHVSPRGCRAVPAPVANLADMVLGVVKAELDLLDHSKCVTRSRHVPASWETHGTSAWRVPADGESKLTRSGDADLP